jgi:peptide chain release factor subunit 3
MDSEDSIPDNWEDDAEEVTQEEAEKWKKETVYVFKSDREKEYKINEYSSLVNHDNQLLNHYSKSKSNMPTEPIAKKETPAKTKSEEIIEKLDKSALIKSLTGKEYDASNRKACVNVVFIGHVDAGKSTICGNLILKTGRIDKRVVEQYELEAKENNRESWWLAYIMDENEDEREKGITIEVGRAFIETPNRTICILDAPGHKNFIPNMISGAAQADIAALVVSARIGEFESGFQKGGQTTEHILLCKSLGVDTFIVLVTKMDTIDWSESRFSYIKSTLLTFLVENCKIEESKIHWIPISGFKGTNLTSVDNSDWYTGRDFLSTLDTCEIEPKLYHFPLRIPILDKNKAQGTVVYGKIESGILVTGMKVCVMPGTVEADIQEIMGVEDAKLSYADAGMNVCIKIKSSDELRVGSIICDPYDFPCITNKFLADVLFLELLPHNPLILPGYSCIIHIGVTVSTCTFEEIIAKYDPITKKKVKAGFCKSNTRAIVKVFLKETTCIEKYNDFKPLGRFALRDEDITIGIGKVINIL